MADGSTDETKKSFNCSQPKTFPRAGKILDQFIDNLHRTQKAIPKEFIVNVTAEGHKPVQYNRDNLQYTCFIQTSFANSEKFGKSSHCTSARVELQLSQNT